MKLAYPVALFALLASSMLTGPASPQPASISWPDAVAQLTGERTKAETCISLLKKYGDEAQIARAQLTYTNAKADSDAVIAGLITALSVSQKPESLSTLQTKLGRCISALHEFCETVSNLIPKTAGQKDTTLGMLSIGSMRIISAMLSDGVSALYNNQRSYDALTRRTIQTQLEAARWPTFSEVKAAVQ